MESRNKFVVAKKIFFARSKIAPNSWSYDHVGFITQNGKQIQMSGHKGNDVYVTKDVTDDPQFPKQTLKIIPLPKSVSVPTTNIVGAENCGTFVANVLKKNGVRGFDTKKLYSVMKKPRNMTNKFLSSLAAKDQAERKEYEKFVQSKARGDWKKGAEMYAAAKKRKKDDIFGEKARLKQFMNMKFDFDIFSDDDWDGYWTLAQHCDHDVDFQKKALANIVKYHGGGDNYKRNYEYLTDRISCNLFGKQKYGTQNICERQNTRK